MVAKALWEGKQQNHPVVALFRREVLELIYQECCVNGKDKLFHGVPAVILVLDRQLLESDANTFIATSRV